MNASYRLNTCKSRGNDIGSLLPIGVDRRTGCLLYTSVFFITAGTFGAMAFYGYTTKKDLTSLGKILFMALIGLIIATIVNMFLESSGFDYILSYAGVAIFVGLTA